MEKRNVFISAGHSNVPGKDRGAVGINGVVEGDLTSELRELIIKELNILGQYVSSDPDNYVTKETIKIVSALMDVRDIAIDIHFNYFEAESARGTEVLIPFKSSDFERYLANKLSENISACLGTRNRGAKTEAMSSSKHLLFMSPNCENLLIEVCFISNKADLLVYLMKKDVIAKSIAKCIYDSLTK